MPQHPKPLSVLQSKVLKWVNDGCPDSIFEGYSLRIAARALADDRYITITGKSRTRTAKITQLGVGLLKSIADSDANDNSRQSEADLFVQKLIDAGGVLEVDGGYSHIAANDALIRDVMKSALRPKGYKLEITSVGSWQHPKYEAHWARHFPDDVDERPVPIPDAVGKYHPVARVFRDGTRGCRKSTSPVQPNCCTRWPRQVQPVATRPHCRRATDAPTLGDPRLSMATLPSRSAQLPLRWKCGSSRRIVAPQGHTPPSTIPATSPGTLVNNTDFVSTGRLQLELTQKYSTNGRQERFRDGKRQQLDIALPAILREIEIQHLENEWKHEQARLKEEETQRRWEAAMKRAAYESRTTTRPGS